MSTDKCKQCDSENLFDTCLDRNGYAVTDGTGRWTTICNDCGTDQSKRKKGKIARSKRERHVEQPRRIFQ